MTKEQELDLAIIDLRDELLRAFAKHPPMNSAHEGHSVIREELDELWDHVKQDTGGGDAARKEALQIAAMGLRYAVDVCGRDQRPAMSVSEFARSVGTADPSPHWNK